MTQAIVVQNGKKIPHTPSSDIPAGSVVVLGSKVFIATAAIMANTLGDLEEELVVRMVKATGAISAWASVYWDEDGDPLGGTAGTGAITTTSSGNIWTGYALEAAAETDTTVLVKVCRAVSVTANHYGPLNNEIADPGNTGAIPITSSGYIDIVTAGAETRTLAAPGFKGQMILLSMKTDGGDCVVAVAATVNQTGNNRITLNDAGDAVLLVAKTSGSSLKWSVVSNDGATLSTV